MKRVSSLIAFGVLALLFLLSTPSCSSSKPVSATDTGPRTMLLSGKSVNEFQVGGFTAWTCKDVFYMGPTQVEVGFFGFSDTAELGFVLFDGGFEGELTHYKRAGLERRWNWVENDTAYDYSFVIKTDGTGLYYDFTLADEKGRSMPRDVYDCRKRKTKTK